MADGKLTIDVNAKGGPSLNKATKSIDKQKKSLDRLDKSQRQQTKNAYGTQSRMKQGMIQTANSTKNFSKLQQTVDGGGGGAGGLVRAYALLAANVFALSAAFGILSRAAQVDNLIASMEQLEVVSGKAILQTARNLQEAAGFGMDYAESMRAASLATSAGFGGEQITELASVARNAAVSLGRNVPDALDRIFRGVIKVEPELLDEIGLFVRVKDAAAKYASDIGVAASELTEFEKRQAFAAEAVRQGTEKFKDFSEVDTDQFSRLAAVFSDIAQNALSMINTFMKPMIDFFAASSVAMTALFSTIIGLLLKRAIPAMGFFAVGAKEAATEAIEANKRYQNDLNQGANNQRTKAYETIDIEREKTKKLLAEARKRRMAGPDYEGQKGKPGKTSALAKANERLSKKGLDRKQKVAALEQKIVALTKSKRTQTEKAVKAAIAGLEREIELEKEILRINKRKAKIKDDFPDVIPGKGSIAEKRGQDLKRNEIFAKGFQNIAGQGEFKGFTAAAKSFKEEWKKLPTIAKDADVPLNKFQKGLFALKGGSTVAAIGIQQMGMAIQAAMGWISVLLPAFMLFTKAMGIGNKEHKAWQEANKNTANVLENLEEKLKAQSEVLRDNTADVTKASQAASAFAKSMAVSVQAVIDAEKAWKKFKEEGTGLAIWWEEVKTAMAGGGVQDQQRRVIEETLKTIDVAEEQVKGLFSTYGNLEDLINNITKGKTVEGIKKDMEELNLLSKELSWTWDASSAKQHFSDEQIARLKEFGIEVEGLTSREVGDKIRAQSDQWRLQVRDGITPAGIAIKDMADSIMGLSEEDLAKFFEGFGGVATDLDTAKARLDSIMESSADVARTYGDLFITKTDVDKPLAVFQQITTESEMLRDDTEARAKFLKDIEKGDNGIWALMTMQNRELFKEAKTQKEKLTVLQKQEDEYTDMQANITVIANLQKQITASTKHWQKIMSKAGEASVLVVTNGIKQLELQKTLKEEETSRMIQQMEKEESMIRELGLANLDLMNAEERKKLADKIGISTKELSDLQSHMIQENIIGTNLAIKLATQELDVSLQIHKVLKQRIDAIDKLNKIREKEAKLNKQEELFQKTGRTKFNVMEETNLILEAEKTRLQIADEKARIEKAIIDAQYGIIQAQINQMRPEITAYNDMVKNAKEGEKGFGLQEIDADTLIADIEDARDVLKDTITEASELAGSEFARKYIDSLIKGLRTKFTSEIKDFTDPGGSFSRMMSVGNVMRDLNMAKDPMSDSRYKKAVDEMGSENDEVAEKAKAMKKTLDDVIENVKENEFALKMSIMKDAVLDFANSIKEFGPEGVLAATIAEFTVGMVGAFEQMQLALEKGANETAAKLAMAAYAIQGVASIASAAGKQKIAAIDQEINAEKRRDGKSKESLARIKALEAEKEKTAKKNFEVQKKLAMANVIMSTAMAVMQVWTNPADWFKTWAGMMTPLILGLGAAQLAIISGTSYQGGGSVGGAPAKPAEISVGKRGNQVDVSKSANAVELAYLSGQK